MNCSHVSLVGCPRILPSPLSLSSVAYSDFYIDQEASFSVRTFQICLRLSGDSEKMTTIVNGAERTETFPHTLVKRPGGEYRVIGPLHMKALYFSYDAEYEDQLRNYGIDELNFQKINIFPEIKQLIFRITELFEHTHEYGVADRLDLLCLMLLKELVFAVRKGRNLSDFAEEKILKIASYFQLHYHSAIDLEALVHSFGFSRRTFSRHWSQYYKVSPGRYLSGLKIQEACRLLQETDHSVVEITEILNYRNSAYFCDFFHRRTGMTPLQYRTKSRKESVFREISP